MVSSSDISPVVQTPLLPEKVEFVEDNVDYKGRPAKRSSSGGWLSASFIIVVQMAEFFAYYGVSANLITYLTGPLGQSTATAAENINAWSGTGMLMPLLGAFVADSFLGRYRTVVIASLLFVLALGLLTLSTLIPSLDWFDCHNPSNTAIPCPPSQLQIATFFFSLYLIAIAQGMHKPCIQAFGADQFDGSDAKECKSKSSFFNWSNVGSYLTTTLSLIILSYIQDNLSWGLGFGIPCLVMVFALVWFVSGTVTYRFHDTKLDRGQCRPFSRIGKVFIKAAKNWRRSASSEGSMVDVENRGVLPHLGSHQFKFLNKALLTHDGSIERDNVCSTSEVEEAKALLGLFPIWLSSLVYGIVVSQPSTLFTQQGLTMDRFITSTFQLPAASLQSFASLTIIVFLPIYDCLLVPVARAITGKPSGITMLQRAGIGLFLAILSVLAAALVEMKRLEVIKEYGLADHPNAIVPMSVAWLIPQYILLGVAQSFIATGLQEFFYDQMPNELRSTGLALYLTIFGIGGFLSSILISVIEYVTGGNWFSDNPMKGHLDYFYWVLTGLSTVAFTTFVYFAKAYTYRKQ